ncbi:hypothetical protein [Rhodococcus pyridinivorans]|uniref:hypothetical protein n=1 Tax=Rhodococcus pyridinivorans TaxID=103816 RepID=UPI000AE6BDC5|nr:hypothetical protein [Rhodococcus pyridinivorans]
MSKPKVLRYVVTVDAIVENPDASTLLGHVANVPPTYARRVMKIEVDKNPTSYVARLIEDSHTPERTNE